MLVCADLYCIVLYYSVASTHLYCSVARKSCHTLPNPIWVLMQPGGQDRAMRHHAKSPHEAQKMSNGHGL